MNSKSKVFLAVLAMLSIVAILVLAIVEIFAASNHKVTTNLSVSYSVLDNITGTVSAKYYLGATDLTGTSMETEDGQTSVTLNKNKPENSLNPPEKGSPISLSSKNSFIVFEYKFENTGANIYASLSFAGTANNMQIFTTDATDLIVPANFATKINTPIETPNNFETFNFMNKDQTSYVYVLVQIGNHGEDATFEGNFSWVLAIDESPANGELFNSVSKTFYQRNVNELIKKITGASKLETLSKNITNSAQLQTIAGEEIFVTLGDLKWTPTYLSQDKEGNAILTLWLDSCTQEAWKTEKYHALFDKFYGFLDGSLYSDWSANWAYDSTTSTYPSNMYSTSYIRAVTLNNGGSYATSSSVLTTCEQLSENAFALFTMQDFGLTDYIVKPSQVSWQESGQSATKQAGLSYNVSNENWSTTSGGGIISGYNYSSKEGYDAWKDDYLWLPSLSETGFSDTYKGIWNTTQNQRANTGNTSSFSSGTVGSASGSAYNDSWLRSAHYNDAGDAYWVKATGSDSSLTGSDVSISQAVRPALHLNLTAILTALYGEE